MDEVQTLSLMDVRAADQTLRCYILSNRSIKNMWTELLGLLYIRSCLLLLAFQMLGVVLRTAFAQPGSCFSSGACHGAGLGQTFKSSYRTGIQAHDWVLKA